jgi:hypothetical protein
VKNWWTVAGAVALVTIVADLLAPPDHAGSWWQTMPAFDLVYGFAGCVATIGMAKLLGTWWVQRPEDYYHEDRS